MASNEMQKSSSDKEPKTLPPPPFFTGTFFRCECWRGYSRLVWLTGVFFYAASWFCSIKSPTSPLHHMMPPYGTPPHSYVTLYPPGGMYGHPSVPQGDTSEGDATKQSEVKEKLPIKRSRGSLGSLNMITEKNSGASTNGAYSKSGESASDGSSEGSDANTQNNSGSGQHDGKDGWFYDHFFDDREVKRQRRKQSNRESARRSRLRKQAECDELAQRADVLNGENASLREEINKLRSQCELRSEELTSENTSLN
ncbi:hypothetical protein DY000_02035317 [Brassica cretica]|uniref:BZIP domain-containing protein n=1 Tax=Brassica cretica TaxID=69181 RepID=A0ABQ7DWZ2_BRACR|nr:hypothetical protein DY000_02035317 [Brassica cretica]